MGVVKLLDIRITPLKRIAVKNGDVLHALKKTDPGYEGFGEAYFSFVDHGAFKAWKLHKTMTMNFIVPVGTIKFIFISENGNESREETIGEENYARLTVPPGIWFGFQGIARHANLLLNLASIEHDPDEVVRKNISEFESFLPNKL